MFITFLKEKKNSPGLNKDQWVGILDFFRSELPAKYPNDYNINESWPLILDDFYIYYCQQKGIKPNIPEDNDYYNEDD